MVILLAEHFKDDQPIFLQIAELIEESIIEDNHRAHQQIPSTNEFAKHYKINPATAAKGTNLLVDQGILYKKRGVGMFVTEEARSIVLEKRQHHFYDHYVLPLLDEAQRIDLPKEKLNKWIEERYYNED